MYQQICPIVASDYGSKSGRGSRPHGPQADHLDVCNCILSGFIISDLANFKEIDQVKLAVENGNFLAWAILESWASRFGGRKHVYFLPA